MEQRPSHQIPQEQHSELGTRHCLRSRPVHRLARPGTRLQDRRTEDQRTPSQSREETEAALRYSRIPRRAFERWSLTLGHSTSKDGPLDDKDDEQRILMVPLQTRTLRERLTIHT